MRIIFAIFLLAAMAASGCNYGPANKNSNTGNKNSGLNFNAPPPPVATGPVDPKFISCNPYFPLVPNSTVKYSMILSSGLIGNVTVVVEQAPDENGRKVFIEKTHIIDQQTSGLEQIQTIEKKFVCDGERVQIVTEKTESKVQGTPSATVFNYRPDSVYLIDPVSLTTPGTKWSLSQVTTFIREGMPPSTSNVATALMREVKGEEEIQTQLGKFKAVKVEQMVGTNKVIYYFVKGLGEVRRDSGEGSRWEMKEYSGLQPAP
jgi:hypothetical protein